ncbi:MAG: AgmX/PglI C-terminal domain-containing protein [bacterium]
MSRAKVIGPLDASAIRKVARHHLAEVRHCYVSVGIAANRNLKGRVEVRFTIKPTGSVGTLRIARSTLHHARTESCIKSAMRRWRFPKSARGSTTVNYPFTFVSKG